MDDRAKVNIQVSFGTRKRFKSGAANEGMTYDAFLNRLMDHYFPQMESSKSPP